MDKSLSDLKFNGIKPLQKLGDHAKMMAFANPLYNLTLIGRKSYDFVVNPTDPWPGDIEKGRQISTGELNFAGQKLVVENVMWEPVGMDENWLMELHGFEWLRDLRAFGGDKARLRARHMIKNWIENYDKWHELSWQPDVLGQRITSWMLGYSFFGESADEYFQVAFFESLSRQAMHLARSTSGKITGLSKIKALRGLIYASICLQGFEGKIEKTFAQLIDALSKQILPDGGHISRSPSQQVEVLKALIEIRALLLAGGCELPEEIQHAIDRMAPALKFFRYKDGGLPLFHGSREGSPALLEMVLNRSYVKGRPLKEMPHSGFQRIVKGQMQVMMDVGGLPTSEYSQKAHLGVLAFEMNYGRERIIVNCGGSLSAGPWHTALRSTMAHSTVSLKQKNAGKIFDNGQVQCQARVTSQCDETKEAVLVDALHDGYLAEFNTQHQRRLFITDQGKTLVGEDSLCGPQGVDFTVRFHLHPTIQASLIQSGQEVLLRSLSGGGWRMKASGAEFDIEESIYAGLGDMPRRSLQIVLKGKTSAQQTIIKWAMRREHI